MIGRRQKCALAIELSYSCNQACAYCYNPRRGVEQGPAAEGGTSGPSVQVLLARVEKLLSAWDVSQVTLTGGEPLRYTGLFELLDCLRARGTYTQLITNGTLVTEATATRLSAYSLGAVQITLNGSTAEAHREHVGRDSFADAIRGAKNLVARGVPVTGCIVVTRNNADQVAAILDVWRALGVSRVALSRFSPAGMSLSRRESWLPRRQDLVTAFTQAQNSAGDTSITGGMTACLGMNAAGAGGTMHPCLSPTGGRAITGGSAGTGGLTVCLSVMPTGGNAGTGGMDVCLQPPTGGRPSITGGNGGTGGHLGPCLTGGMNWGGMSACLGAVTAGAPPVWGGSAGTEAGGGTSPCLSAPLESGGGAGVPPSGGVAGVGDLGPCLTAMTGGMSVCLSIAPSGDSGAGGSTAGSGPSAAGSP